MRSQLILIKEIVIALLVIFSVQVNAVDRSVSSGGDIQEAIDFVASSGGGTVSLAAGTYMLFSSIQMKSNITLEGVGIATRLELPADATYAMIVDDGSEPCVNMTIRNMLLDGNIPESKVSHDPDYEDIQKSCLGIYFDAYNSATYHLNIVLENIEIHNTVDACHMKGVDGGYWDNVYFHHNGIFYWPGHNSYLRRVNNYVVQNSRFEDSYNGSGINCSYSENLVFTNCVVLRSNGRGIRNAASDGFEVHDCIIKDCGTEGIIANSEGGILTTNIDFRRNYVTGNGGYGIGGGASGVAYENNSFNNSGSDYSLGSAVTQSGNISDLSMDHSLDSNEPYGSSWSVPGQIEAEEYDLGGEGIAYHDSTSGNSGGQFRTDDVDIISCSEGGYAVVAVDDEWLSYTLSVAVEGVYHFDVRYAAETDGAIRFSRTGLDITDDVMLPATGGSNTWETARVLEDITLEPGVYSFRVHISGDYQLNFFTISKDAGMNLLIKAEDYLTQSGTSISTCSDDGGGQNVSFISNNNWCQYDEVVPGAGGVFRARIAAPTNKPNSAIEIRLGEPDGMLLATVDVPHTGGWQTWETVEVDFPAVPGRYPLYLKFVETDTTTGTSLFNLNWFEMAFDSVEYEAEAFDAQSGTSLGACSDVGGGTNVAYISNGDWCRYDNLFIASQAVFRARIARPSGRPNGQIEIRANDPSGTLLGMVDVPETGGWQTYETVEVTLNVMPDTYAIYLKFVEDGTSGGSTLFNLNWFSITPSSKVSPPENFTAEAVDADQIDLLWNSQTNASSYKVKRSNISDGPYSEWVEGLTVTHHSDLGVLVGIKYYYVVTTLYGSAESGNSIVVSAVPSIPLGEGDLICDLVGIQTNAFGEFCFSLSVEASTLGHSYQMLASDSLMEPDWMPVTDVVSGNGGVLQFEVEVDGAETNQFYKLEAWRQ
ncbi:MAG: carbohydrate-binding protein [Pontiella sp.]